MKVLIFSADYGNGHKKVASYMANKYEQEGHRVEIINPCREENKLLAKTSENIYSFVSKNSKYKLIKNSYGIAFEMFATTKGTVFSKFGEKIIKKEIEKYNPDLVIFTFPYQPKNINAKAATIITDYGFSKNWYNESGSYIVGSEEIKKDLLKINPTLNIYNVGIPIGEEIQEISRKPSIDNLSFLINLGAIGICDIKQIKSLIKVLVDKNMNVIVICGRNGKLKVRLLEFVEKYNMKNVEINGYVNNIKETYTKTSIMFTKAGGVTITEAINYEIPLLIDEINSMSGQEKMNIQFVEKKKIGINLNSDKSEEINEKIEYMLDLYHTQIENIKKIKHNYANNQLEFKLEDI